MGKPKEIDLFVVVEGGLIQSIFATKPGPNVSSISFAIIDWDNAAEDDDVKKQAEEFAKEIDKGMANKTLHELF